MYKNSLEKIIEKTLELESQADKNLTIEENLEAILLGHFPDCDSKKIVSQIMAGDAAVRKHVGSEETVDYEAMSAEELEETFRMRVKNFNSMIDMVRANNQYDIGNWDHIDENLTATIENMQELDGNFDLLIDSIMPLIFDNEETAQHLDENSSVMENIDDSHRYYLELAMYILVAQGEIHEIPEVSGGLEEQTPYSIGAMIAAVFEAIKAKLAGIKGKMTWDNVKSVLKKIFKALIDVLKAAGCVYLLYFLFGPNVLAFLTKVAIVFWVLWAVNCLSEWVKSGNAREFWIKTWAKIKNITADAAEKTRNAGQALHSWYRAFIAWIKEKVHWIKETANNKLDNFIETYKTRNADNEDNDDDDNYEFSNDFQNQPAF